MDRRRVEFFISEFAPRWRVRTYVPRRRQLSWTQLLVRRKLSVDASWRLDLKNGLRSRGMDIEWPDWANFLLLGDC
jgi:hypothetical protein